MKAFGQSDAYLSLPPLRHCLWTHPWSAAHLWCFRTTRLNTTTPKGWEVVTATCEEQESGLADNEADSMHGTSSYFNQSKNIHFIEGTLTSIVIWLAASVLFPIKCTVHFNTKWKCILIFYRAAQISVLSKSTRNVKKISFQVRVYQILKAFKDQI